MEENETAVVATEETGETVDTAQPESTEAEPKVEQPKAEKPKRTPEEELEHLLGRVKRLQKDLGKTVESVKENPKPTTSGLDETQLDYLDLKGITESEDIDVIQKVITKTGQTVRQALKDEYVQAKLAANKAQRDVQAATPSSTKRSGAGAENLDSAIARYEQTGELPTDFELRSAVVNRLEAKSNPNVPAWRR